MYYSFHSKHLFSIVIALQLLGCAERIFDNPADPAVVLMPPVNLTITSITEQAATLIWEDRNTYGSYPRDRVQYQIERSSDGSNFQLVMTVPGGTTTAVVQATYLSTTTYTFRIRIGAGSKTTAYVANTANLAFPAPTGLSVISLTHTQAQLTWQDNSSFESGFELRWGIDSASLATTQTVAANATSAVVAGIFDSISTYYFRVRAISAYNQSRYSNTASASWGLMPEWVAVPAGQYTWGQGDTVRSINYDYQIMKNDVTNAQYLAYLNAARAAGRITISGSFVQGTYSGDPRWPAGTYTFYSLGDNTGGTNHYGQIKYQGGVFILTPDTSYLTHPVVYVTWFGAWAFADFYGLRLPTEEEWEKAARGNTGYDYPWGNSITYQNANYWTSGDPFTEGTTPVGYYNGQRYGTFQTTNSPSPYVAYDMAGNVWQWTNSFYGGSNPTFRVLRGGSWFDFTNFLQGWNRYFNFPTNSLNDIGFRCARTF